MMFYCHTSYTSSRGILCESGKWYEGVINKTFATTNDSNWDFEYVLLNDVSVSFRLSYRNIEPEFPPFEKYFWTQEEFREKQLDNLNLLG